MVAYSAFREHVMSAVYRYSKLPVSGAVGWFSGWIVAKHTDR